MRRVRLVSVAKFCVGLAGCGACYTNSAADGGSDAGAADATTSDAGAPPDVNSYPCLESFCNDAGTCAAYLNLGSTCFGGGYECGPNAACQGGVCVATRCNEP